MIFGGAKSLKLNFPKEKTSDDFSYQTPREEEKEHTMIFKGPPNRIYELSNDIEVDIESVKQISTLTNLQAVDIYGQIAMKTMSSEEMYSSTLEQVKELSAIIRAKLNKATFSLGDPETGDEKGNNNNNHNNNNNNNAVASGTEEKDEKCTNSPSSTIASSTRLFTPNTKELRTPIQEESDMDSSTSQYSFLSSIKTAKELAFLENP